MTILKSALVKGALAAAVAAGTLGAAASASAYVACNRAGECWHVQDRVDYPAGLGIRFHDEDWGSRHHHGYRWRHDHDGRGYYRNGLWIAF